MGVLTSWALDASVSKDTTNLPVLAEQNSNQKTVFCGEGSSLITSSFMNRF